MAAGGTLFASAAAASLNEFNLTSAAARRLFTPVSAAQPVLVDEGHAVKLYLIPFLILINMENLYRDRKCQQQSTR